MALIKSQAEIELIHEGGKKLANILNQVAKQANPGVTTAELDKLAENLIVEQGGRPSFKGYGNPPYPSALCTSINDQVVHGIPNEHTWLKNGDVLSLDIGMQYPAKDGLYSDMAITLAVGQVGKEVKKLIEVTKQALRIIEKNLRPGIDLQVISKLVQEYVEAKGFSLVRDLVGHGVGHEVHEEPQLPNYVIPSYHLELKTGMVLAFEPMVIMGNYQVKTNEDKWTVETVDGSLAAHFEHTFAVIESGNKVLTRE